MNTTLSLLALVAFLLLVGLGGLGVGGLGKDSRGLDPRQHSDERPWRFLL